MFYFHDPLMNTAPIQSPPPAIARVVEAPASPLAPPKGWQWANSKSSSAVAPDTVAGGDEDLGKKEALSSPSIQTPLPASPCTVSAQVQPVAVRAWQPPKGYVEWTTPCECRQTIKVQPHVVVAPAALPTWSVVSWKNIAPRSITGTRKEAVAMVENDLSMAGIHHLDVHVYDAIHVIVALQR